MAKADFMAPDDPGKADQMDLFRVQIVQFLAQLGLLNGGVPIPEITQQAADSIYFRALLTVQLGMQNSAKAWTGWKNYERDGGAFAVPTPIPFALPSNFPAAVPPGIVVRFRALAQMVKKCTGYTVAIGTQLGIEGAEPTAPDLNTVQPVIDAIVTASGVGIGWDWQGNAQFLQACEIQCDHSDTKGFVTIMIDNTPGYEDNTPFPATPTKWTYRAIYRVGDKRVGLWSAPVSVNVGG